MTLAQKVRQTLPALFKDPTRAIPMIVRAVAPIGIHPKDSEARRIAGWNYGKLPRVPITEAFPGIERVEVRIVRAHDRTFNVSMDANEVLVLASIVSHLRPKRVIEIGTFDGNTTLNIAANLLPESSVVTVDLPPKFTKDQFTLNLPATHVNINDHSLIGAQFRDSTYASQITQVLADSMNLDWSTLGGPFDLVFIDGCHDYRFVKQDTENALRHVAPGGLIIWHDYGMLKDVSKLVDETKAHIPVTAIRATRIAIGFPSGS